MTFRQLSDLPENNTVVDTSQKTTVRVQCTHDGPPNLLPPPGIEVDFAIFHDGAWETADLVFNSAGLTFQVTVPVGGVTLERVRYIPDVLVWLNTEGGFLEGFDLPVPFP